jgi:hypothetical protein
MTASADDDRFEPLPPPGGEGEGTEPPDALARRDQDLRRQQAFAEIRELIGKGGIAPDAVEELHHMRKESDRSFLDLGLDTGPLDRS